MENLIMPIGPQPFQTNRRFATCETAAMGLRATPRPGRGRSRNDPPSPADAPRRTDNTKLPRHRVISVLAELIARGDGTFVLKPRLTDQDLETWLSVRHAAQVLGNVTAKSLYRLLGEFLVYRRPLRYKIVVSLRSILALKQATNDPEFWENAALQQKIRVQVRTEMNQLIAEAEEKPPTQSNPGSQLSRSSPVRVRSKRSFLSRAGSQ
jgi:hypothetical protein